MDIIGLLEIILYLLLGVLAILIFVGFPWALYSQHKEKTEFDKSQYEREHIGFREQAIE